MPVTEYGDLPASKASDDAEDAAEATRPYRVVPADDPTPGVPGHLAPDDAGDRPWIDPSRDPTPGVGGHRAPDGDGE